MKIPHKKSLMRRLVVNIYKESKWSLVLGFFFLIQVALTLYFPILIGRAVDTVLDKQSLTLILPILFQMFVVVSANTFIQWLNPLIYTNLIYRYTAKIRQDTLEKLNRMPISYLDKRGVGDLISRLTTDTEQLSNGLMMAFNQFFTGILLIIITIIIMAKLDMLMLVIVLISTPLSMFAAQFIAKKSYYLYKKQTTLRGEQAQFIEEMVNQETLIQTMNAQDITLSRFEELNATYSEASQSAIFYSSTVNPTTRFINGLIYATLIGIGANRIISGAFTVGELTIFLNYVNQYTKPFNDISSVLSEMQSSLACANRLYRILDEEEPPKQKSMISLPNDLQGHLIFDHVAFGYQKDKLLIRDLNLDVAAGERVAIVGPTGAGKSTLINLLMRFYDIDKGTISLDGIPIQDYAIEALRDQIGMVLQETWLTIGTVHDNIAYGMKNASREAVIKAAKAANADFFIRQLPNGYDTYLADAGESLSQGQRQLLTIARVFLKQPKLLILDEATSSIDSRTEVLIQSAFDDLMQSRTSFIIAHRLSTIKESDIILVMKDGDIVEKGSHGELMAEKGAYYDMQMAQV